ncbi:MBL fold metallo-hydrolase [Merdibacter massiliensis]|uniref:MBL fold metallo-hydrolase n=1 Tax=Merdibacter massiliensis TaxID=1871030 RepID=UPI00096AC6FA|nr:MBL fold metallo-hydrolase [Merdibacter massiliensis]
MKAALLESGSKGNCCLIKHKGTKIVIDCGGTKRYLQQCLQTLQCDVSDADALLVTHTHKDHVAQLNSFRHLPAYAWADLGREQQQVEPFETFWIKDIQVQVLPLSHDAEHTIGFVLEADGEKLVYITDTGYVRNDVKERICNADYYVFESNHDVEMLMQTNRPIYIKQRIINDYGHLNNEDSAQVLREVIGERTKEIVLAHISQEGNTRAQAHQTLEHELSRHGFLRNDLRLYPAQQFGIHIFGSKED